MSALFQSGYLPIVSFRSRLSLRQDSLSIARESTSRCCCFLSQKWAVIQTIRCESESYSGEEVEDLTAKVFGGDFDLFQRILFRGTGRSLKSVNPYFKPKGPY